MKKSWDRKVVLESAIEKDLGQRRREATAYLNTLIIRSCSEASFIGDAMARALNIDREIWNRKLTHLFDEN